MKYLTNYFPFIILSFLLYGLFFYLHDNTPIETKLHLQTGQQAIKMQLSAPLATSTPATAIPNEEIESLDNSASKRLDKAISAEKKKLTAQQIAKVKVAKKQHQESIKNNSASADAQLKEHIFNQEIATLENVETTQNKTVKTQEKRTSVNVENAPSIASLLPITEALAAPAKISKSSKAKITPKTIPNISKADNVPPKNKAAPKIKHTFKPSSGAANEPSAAAKQGVLQEAVVVSGNIPNYPNRAVLRMQQGRVVVKIMVMDSGKTTGAKIITSSGYSILDEEVLAFISRELFLPALRGTDKITAEQLFSFRFELN